MQSNRIDEMDAKLDVLLEMMQTSDAPHELEPRAQDEPQSANQAGHSVQSAQSIPPDQPSSSNAIPTPGLQPSELMSAYSLANPGTRDIKEALDLFRGSMLGFCPFMYLHPDLQSQKLQQDRPFLFEAILAVTTRSANEKVAWANRIKSTVAQALVVENQSNLDLLLGILTYVSWSQDHFLLRRSTLCRLVELAVSIINDLHLSKPLPVEAHRLTELGGENDCNLRRKVPQIRSAEEKRAVLGCFILSS